MKRKQQAMGCLAAIVVLGGLIVGVAKLGDAIEGEPTRCERFARMVAFELDNCHSGQTRNQARYEAICERELDPSDACLSYLDSLTCDAIDPDVLTAVRAACARPQP